MHTNISYEISHISFKSNSFQQLRIQLIYLRNHTIYLTLSALFTD